MIPCLVTIFLLGCSANTDSQGDSSSPPPKSSDHHLRSIRYQRDVKDTPFGEDEKPKPKLTLNQQQKTNNKQNEIKGKKILNVPLIKQNPELKYGCEVTSLAMLLQFAGKKVNKMTLANKIKKDTDPIKRTKTGDIVSWGDPEDGFVGDMTGKRAGYAVYDKQIVKLMEKYLPNRSINLTGKSFDEVLKQVSNDRPVVVWTTGNYRLPDRWEEWKHNGETIKTPLDLHVVVLVGYDDKYVYVNDPLSGKKNQPVDKQTFIQSWKALKQRAVSYN